MRQRQLILNSRSIACREVLVIMVVMKFTRILCSFVLTLIFIIPFIPLVVTTSLFFPYITGKNFIFRILVELAFGGWVALAIASPLYRPRATWFTWLLVIFLGIIGIADILSPDPFKSFWSSFERMEGYITLLHLFGYFLIASTVLSTQKLWIRFFQTSIGVSIAVSFHSIFQLAGISAIYQSASRVEATVGNASYLATYMLIHIFLTLFLLIREDRSRPMKYVYSAFSVLQMLTLYETATRGALLGVFSGFLTFGCIILLMKHDMKSLRKIALAGFLVFGIGITLLFVFKDTALIRRSTPLARFSSISSAQAGPRLSLWNIAWQGLKERPLLGWGQENFNYVFNKYYDPKMYAQEQWFDRTHNIFFDWLIVGGVLGLAGYCALYGYTFFALWRGKSILATHRFIGMSQKQNTGSFQESMPLFSVPERSILTGLLVAYAVQNLFVFDNLLSYIFFFSFIAYVDMNMVSTFFYPQKLGESKTLSFHPRGALYATPLIAIATITGVYFLNVPALRAAAGLVNAINSYQEGPEINLEYFRKILEYRSFGTPEIRGQLLFKTLSLMRANEAPKQLKQDFLTLTLQEYKKQLAATPDDAREYLLFGTFLNSIEFPQDALVQLEKARQLSPGKQHIYFEIATAYFALNEIEKTKEAARIAYELEPSFADAYYAYTIALIYNKEIEMVHKLQKERFGNIHYPNGRLIAAYRDTGEYDQALEQWKEAVRLYPDTTDYNFGLALAHLEATKEPDETFTILRRTAEKYPELRERVEFCIKEITAGRRPNDQCSPEK